MKIGVIGAGNWGHRVINEYIILKDENKIEDVYICDSNQKLLQEYPLSKYSSYKELLNQDLDGVHICAPNELHYRIAKDALNKGIHVLMEKPLTLKSKYAFELIELASENGKILQVGHIYRFANVINRLKELKDDGFFGDIRYLTFKWTTKLRSTENFLLEKVDIIWDLMPHILDIINFLTGKYPIRSFVLKGKKKITFLSIEYEDFIVNVELSWVTPERKRELRIIGSEKTAKVNCVAQEILVFDEKNNTNIPVEANNTIKDEILNFIESIKTGKMLFNSHIVGAMNVSAIEKILEAMVY